VGGLFLGMISGGEVLHFLYNFQDFYDILNNKEASIFSWKRSFSVWEVNLLNNLFEVVDCFNYPYEPDLLEVEIGGK
jgi:hypothetical protein